MPESAKILIVDDIDVNRILLEDLMTILGYTPSLAENGVAALAKMKEDPPDIVLLDILMPEMNGYEVLEIIKADENLCNIPVIMITGVDELQSVAKCIKKGAEDYLIKPFNSTLLEARICNILERKRSYEKEQALQVELARNYEALQEAEKARKAMFNMIVHDLKNYLASMILVADVSIHFMKGGKFDEERLIKDFSTILNTGEEMSSLIEEILVVSKLETGKMPVSFTALDAVQLTKGIFARFVTQARENEIRLVHEFESTFQMTHADKSLLSRTLHNLLSNAFKYAGDGKQVSLSVSKQDGNTVFCVKDSGPGIPEKYKEKIFGKFFQIDSGMERKAKGVGLGLAFCKMAAEAQGGKIWVESTEGQGASFKVALKAMES